MYTIGNQYTYAIYILIVYYIGGELYTGDINRIFAANRVIIGVSIVSIVISVLVVMYIINAFRRRSILFRTIRRQAQTIAEYQDTCLNPPPYDFYLPIAPSYATNPPTYTRISNGGDDCL